MTDPRTMETVLRRGLVCRLGLLREGFPYIVPLSYGYEDGCLYFHCAPEGLKLDCIRECPRACFQVDCGVRVREAVEACGWTMDYSSVIGYGTVSEVEDAGEKLRGLRTLMGHYSGREDWDIPASLLERTTVLRLRIDSMTGRSSTGGPGEDE